MFEKWLKKYTFWLEKKFGLDKEDIPKPFKKVWRFIAFKLSPIITTIGMFMVTSWIFFHIYERLEFEKTIIFCFICIIFVLRNMNKKMNKMIIEVD